jgi:hypothetical protein
MKPLPTGLSNELQDAIDNYMLDTGEGFYDLPEVERQKRLGIALTQDNFITLRYLYNLQEIKDASRHIDNIVSQIEIERPDAGTKWQLEGIQYYLDPTFRIPVDPASVAPHLRYDPKTFKLQQGVYYFLVQPALVVEEQHKNLEVPEHLKRWFHKTGFSPVMIHDYEFFERHKGFKAVIDDIFNKPLIHPYEGLTRSISAADYRQHNLIRILHEKKDKPFNAFKIFSAEELEDKNVLTPALYSYVKDFQNYVVDDSVFTAFGDKEKIHIQILELSTKDGEIFIPYFIGLGNNYPFSRAINTRTAYGDDRFYRESYDTTNNEYIVQKYVKNRSWKIDIENFSSIDFQRLLIARAQGPKRAFQYALDMIDSAQKVYPDYFSEVLDIEKLFIEFCIKRGIDPKSQEVKEKKYQDYRLMLDPNIRFRSCALVAYNTMAKIQAAAVQ